MLVGVHQPALVLCMCWCISCSCVGIAHLGRCSEWQCQVCVIRCFDQHRMTQDSQVLHVIGPRRFACSSMITTACSTLQCLHQLPSASGSLHILLHNLCSELCVADHFVLVVCCCCCRVRDQPNRDAAKPASRSGAKRKAAKA
jgi:hypothetical protein